MKKVVLLSLLAFSSAAIATDTEEVTAIATKAVDTTATDKAPVTGFYVGGDIGSTHLNLDNVNNVNNVDENGSALSVGLYGGYHFNEWLGLEVHLYGSGDHSDIASVDLYATVLSLTPTFTLHFDKTFSGYLKAGVSYIDVDFQYDADVLDKMNTDLTGLGYVVGAGIDAAISKQLALRLAYEFTSGELEFNNTGNYKTNLSQLSVGMHYLF